MCHLRVLGLCIALLQVLKVHKCDFFIVYIVKVLSSDNLMQAVQAAQLRLTPPYFNIAENRWMIPLPKTMTKTHTKTKTMTKTKTDTALLQHRREQVGG